MAWRGELWRRIGFLRRARQFDAEMEEELQFHAAMQALPIARAARTNRRRAMRPCAAWGTRQRSGKGAKICGDGDSSKPSRRIPLCVPRAAQESRVYAVAVLSLGLGSAQRRSCSAYSMPWCRRHSLSPMPRASISSIIPAGPAQSFPNYRDIRDRNSVFESLFAYRITMMSLDDDRGAHRVWGYWSRPTISSRWASSRRSGRFFTPAEDVHPNASPYAVLGYACWRNRSAPTRIAGRDDAHQRAPVYPVLGVAPRGFHGTEVF